MVNCNEYDCDIKKEDDGFIPFCNMNCKKDNVENEKNRLDEINNNYDLLKDKMFERQNSISTTNQFVQDTKQIWRFERMKFIFLIICTILIAISTLYIVYRNIQ